MIKHAYDSDNLLVSFEKTKDTPNLPKLFKSLIVKTLDRAPESANDTPCVGKLDDTNKFSFGKVMVSIKRISHFFSSCTFFVRISVGPYVLETRQMVFEAKVKEYS